jgi:hypothetical protein
MATHHKISLAARHVASGGGGMMKGDESGVVVAFKNSSELDVGHQSPKDFLLAIPNGTAYEHGTLPRCCDRDG